MASYTNQPVLDESGNLQVHNQQGFQIVLGFDGVDMSDEVLWFGVSNGYRRSLVNGPLEDQKILEVQPHELEDILNRVAVYTITNETTPLHELVLEGTIHVRGY